MQCTSEVQYCGSTVAMSIEQMQKILTHIVYTYTAPQYHRHVALSRNKYVCSNIECHKQTHEETQQQELSLPDGKHFTPGSLWQKWRLAEEEIFEKSRSFSRSDIMLEVRSLQHQRSLMQWNGFWMPLCRNMRVCKSM